MAAYTVQSISFDTFANIYRTPGNSLDWPCPFVLPVWLETTTRYLGKTVTPHLLAVYESGQPVGIAPLSMHGSLVRFLGSPEVCDYQDIISAPGAGFNVTQAIIAQLRKEGLRTLDLRTLRPDATIFNALKQMRDEGLVGLTVNREAVTYETALPATWELYLHQLKGKQRHEVRRKLRRLEAAGAIAYEMADDGNRIDLTEDFLMLFRRNREDKVVFMSDVMESYFRHLIDVLSNQGLLRLYLLRVDHQPAAAVFCIDFKGVRYLYNSGYDERYQELSVGVLCKIFSIQKGIEMGCRRYDFLKGAETYKKRIGGQELSLYHCLVEL